jgi:hypothetical protein
LTITYYLVPINSEELALNLVLIERLAGEIDWCLPECGRDELDVLDGASDDLRDINRDFNLLFHVKVRNRLTRQSWDTLKGSSVPLLEPFSELLDVHSGECLGVTEVLQVIRHKYEPHSYWDTIELPGLLGSDHKTLWDEGLVGLQPEYELWLGIVRTEHVVVRAGKDVWVHLVINLSATRPFNEHRQPLCGLIWCSLNDILFTLNWPDDIDLRYEHFASAEAELQVKLLHMQVLSKGLRKLALDA